jgi:glutamate-1-semialdehyde aminotransferase
VDVDRAVHGAIASGSACSLNPADEVELAKLLVQIHPWAQQVKFTRSGGEAVAVAIRIAQAKTGMRNVWREKGSYHGWMVNNPLTDRSYLPSDQRGLAAILVEPRRLSEPSRERLEGYRRMADETGAVLIFDEITSGFRFNLGGSHLELGVNPDIAVFAKAMSNGYPMAAVIGAEAVMSATQDTFISSTSWSERIGPTAALATITKFWAENVHEHLDMIGSMVQSIWRTEARKAGLEVTIAGPPQLSHIDFGSAAVQTLYTQMMLDRGFLASKDFYPSFAHLVEDVEEYLEAVRWVFTSLQEAKAHGAVEKLLAGPVAWGGLRRI